MVWHGRDEFVEHAALAEQRVCPRLGCVGFEQSVHAEALAGSTQHREQGHGERVDEEQAIAPSWLADARGGKAHAEPQVLGVAERRLDGPSLGVVIDQFGSWYLAVAGGQTPRLLHRAGMNADDGADLISVRRRDPGCEQLAGAACLADPIGRRPRLARRIGDMDVAAKADDVGEAKIAEVCEQLVIAEAAIGEDGDTATRWHDLGQAYQAGILEGVALLRQFLFPHRQPQQRCRPATTRLACRSWS